MLLALNDTLFVGKKDKGGVFEYQTWSGLASSNEKIKALSISFLAEFFNLFVAYFHSNKLRNFGRINVTNTGPSFTKRFNINLKLEKNYLAIRRVKHVRCAIRVRV
mmetsp:Transcript_16107/g.20642  ORF Transcript_16107/g.20642 Transcript_16107/m.20642 type:complete len:106 (+) Transcript_16107:1056-1373(+)